MKILWFDTETTGLDPKENDIIQISGIIEIDGEEKESFDLKCRPHNPDNITEQALNVIKKTKEEILSWPEPDEVYQSLINIFSGWIDKFDRNDKFLPAGHNPQFDIQMLSQFFFKCGDKYFGSWMSWQPLDTMSMSIIAQYLGLMPKLPTNKLEDLAKHFNIPLDAHDAFNDIVATRKAKNELIKLIGGK